jgi:pSer/pThr/pTyr-binding forkhead associated (FHA) protein
MIAADLAANVWHTRAVDRVYLEYVGNLIEIPVGESRVGRDLESTIRLDDAGVSRHHVRVVRRGDGLFIEDLGSRNGTLVNGRPITGMAPVHDGDIIVLSTRVLTVRINPLQRAKRNTLANSEEVDRGAASAVTVPPMVTKSIAISRRPCAQCGVVVSELDDRCHDCGSGSEAGPATRNRRREERHPIAVDVRYVSPELEIEVTSRDLSESGVFVCSQLLDPVGTTCELMFELADRQFGTHGVVRRVVDHHDASRQPVGLGVEFISLGQRERDMLRHLIADPSTHVRRATP